MVTETPAERAARMDDHRLRVLDLLTEADCRLTELLHSGEWAEPDDDDVVPYSARLLLMLTHRERAALDAEVGLMRYELFPESW